MQMQGAQFYYDFYTKITVTIAIILIIITITITLYDILTIIITGSVGESC